jgi:trimethylamine--corrinoid protein Co-methyltransferase
MKFTYNNKYPHYQLFSPEELESIHEATLNVMETFGVRVYGEQAHRILKAAGCTIDEDTGLIKFPRELVNKAIKATPGSYTIFGRIPEHDRMISHDHVLFTNFGTGVEILDLKDGRRRESNSADLGNVARFCDGIDEIDAFTTAVSATDVPPALKDLYEAKIIFENTSKHAILDAENGENARFIIDMASGIAGSHEAVSERPFFTLCTCPNSPLEIHQGAAEVMVESAKAHVPCSILSMGLVGATTPSTLAGTLVCTNAEILAGVVLVQTVNPGNPVLYGSSTTIMDMQHVTSPVGAPEHAMFGAAVAQLGEYYDIPTKVGGT